MSVQLSHAWGVSAGGSENTANCGESVRLDRWLWAVRLFKTRTLAQEACSGGHVKLNGATAKPGAKLRVGDEVQAVAPRGLCIYKVVALAEKRVSAPLAQELFEDHSPPPPPKEDRVGIPMRERGAGRPTKADRRAMQRLRGRY